MSRNLNTLKNFEWETCESEDVFVGSWIFWGDFFYPVRVTGLRPATADEDAIDANYGLLTFVDETHHEHEARITESHVFTVVTNHPFDDDEI